MGKESKTARASTGKKGGAGRVNLCPTHGTPLTPAILVRMRDGRLGRGYNSRYHGWICGAKGTANIEADASTHYLTRSLEEWRP